MTNAKSLAALFLCTTLIFAGLFVWQLAAPKTTAPAAAPSAGPAAGDGMKITPAAILDEAVKARERQGDHPGSPYYPVLDFYHMQSGEGLTILPKFRTFQQTAENTCGPACALMVLDHYGRLGDWTEASLLTLVPDHSDLHSGLCLEQMAEIFRGTGLRVETSAELRGSPIDERMIQMYLEDGIPVVIGWQDRGGHWQVIIGYDDMGTPENLWDDVVILADPSDDTDHNQDGYYCTSMQRLMACWSFYDLRGLDDHETDYCFLAPSLPE